MCWLATSGILATQPAAVLWAAEAAAGLFLLCLLKPLIEPQRRGVQVYPIDPQKEPLLRDITAKVCEQIGAPQPKTIQLECSTRMVATKQGRVLTLGLPVVASISAEQ